MLSEWAAQPEVGPTGSVDARWEVTWGRGGARVPEQPSTPPPQVSLPAFSPKLSKVLRKLLPSV